MAADRDRAVGDVDAALAMIIVDRQPCAGVALDRDVERAREHLHRRGQPVGVAGDDAQPHAALVEAQRRQRRGRMVMERGRGLLVGLRQGDPGLDAVHAVAGGALGRRRALGVDDTAAGRHPVDVAGPDHLVETEAVAVLDRTVEQIRDRGQADVRMRPHVHADAGRHLRGADVVEEHERPQVAPQDMRQEAGDLEMADVVDAGLDRLELIGHGGLWENRC